MSRVSLPRLAKRVAPPSLPGLAKKVAPLSLQPVVVGGEVSPHVGRFAKKVKLSNGLNDPNDPNGPNGPQDEDDSRPVYVPQSDPQDLDFAPTTRVTASGTARNSKKRILSAIQSPLVAGASDVAAVVPQSTITRPEPHGQPPIWAEERQHLCEALPYYRAYQSGAYTLNNLAYGFLIDKDSSGARSYLDEEIVITRAGGGCKADTSGNMQQNSNQSGDTSQISSFRNCIQQKHAVGLILGSANEDCSTAIPHRYCVMDWFKVTDVWAEKLNGKVTYKFRFEKVELGKKSWWAPKGSPLPSPIRDFNTKAASKSCSNCHVTSKEIYRDGWMCLNDQCSTFFSIHGQTPANPSYTFEFLNERSSWPESLKLGSLAPEPLLVDPLNASYNFSRASWKAMVCPHCGRCNSRIHWAKWQCQTPDCGFSHNITLTPLSYTAVLPSHGFQGTGHAVPQDSHSDPVILREPEFLGHWRIHTFDVMADSDSQTLITHYHANTLVNQMSGGANDMFHALQQADLGLQRFPLKASPIKGEMLTKHFTSNYGMPYKFIVAVDSKPFKGAPQVILEGLNRLTWAGKHTVCEPNFLQFNELLALGYFEEQSIGYHDDGEVDLGPTIATISLGGEAEMHVRMKEKYYNAKKIRFNPYNPDAPVIKGCQFYEERLALNALHKSGCSDKVLRAAESKLQLETQKKGRVTAPPILSMKLHHGDMVVMHGGDIQKYFEHSVTPGGKLRFALTARYVNPSMIDPSDHWKSDFFIDPTKAYNGDVDSLDPVESDMSLPNQDKHMMESDMSLPNQDKHMMEILTENTLSSSQLTLVAEDSVLSPSKALDQLEEITDKHVVSNGFDELNLSVQAI